MSKDQSDHVGGIWLVVLTLVTWLMVLVLQGCAGSGSSGSRHDMVLAAALTFCTEQCLPFGVLHAGLTPSPDGTTPYDCECMPAGYEAPDEEPEKKPGDNPEKQRITMLETDGV
jgi:hypothetical protein